MSDLGLCRYCHQRPAVPAIYRNRRCYQCYQCFHVRYRETRARNDKTYKSKPEAKRKHRETSRVHRKREVRIGNRTITMPTVEAKQQATELIARGRDVFKSRQSRGAQGEAPAANAVPVSAGA